jgi:hypothetical protein
MAAKKYVSARDGEGTSVIYTDQDGAEFLHSGGTRAWRNNNPGNLVASEKSGLKIGKGGRFAAFATHDDGFAALKYSLTHYYAELKLDDVFKKYAPSTDNNDPEHYIKLVKQYSGLDSSRKLGELNESELKSFMQAIERVEGWKAGKIEPIPHAQQFALKGVDDKPLCGIDYVMSFFSKSGEEQKVRGKTDDEGKTAVAKTDTRSPVTLKLPRPDPGQSLKGTGVKAKGGGSKEVVAAEVKAKPWYAFAFSSADDSEDEKNDGAPAGKGGAAAAAGAAAGATGAAAAGKKADKEAAAKPAAPTATVRQAGAIRASGTRNKADQHVEQVVKEPGVFVTWQFDTSAGSGKVLNGLPYFIAEMSGDTGKPLVQGERVKLMRDNKIRQKVPFGKEVALYLGNDAKSQYRKTPLYRVTAEEGLTDVVVKIAETRGLNYDAAKEVPAGGELSGTKKIWTAKLYGTTWKKFSHKFTPAEAEAVAGSESQEVRDALKQIYEGAAVAAANAISLSVVKPNKGTMKILWPKSAFGNCMDNIPAIAGLTNAKDEIIPRVNPSTYKAFLKAAFDLDADELEINSGWRPMLGSVLHRIGVGLDVGRLKVGGENKTFRRSATPAESAYNSLMSEKKKLAAKKTRTEEESTRLNELKANEAAKGSAAIKAIHDNESTTLRSFTTKLRANGDVRQTFDPWEMDLNTGDNVAEAPNRLVTGNETLHRNHLHITVRDSDLGH